MKVGERLVAVARFPGKARARRHIHLGADDRLDAGGHALLVEFNGAEHGAVVGNGHRRHPVLFGLADQVREPDSAVQQRILAMKVKMDKLWLLHGHLGR